MTTCSDCGETYDQDNIFYTKGNKKICRKCFSQYGLCFECCKLISPKERKVFNDTAYCSECYERTATHEV